MKRYFIFYPIAILSVLSSSCTPSYTIQLIEGESQKALLNVPKGELIKVGDIFALYHLQATRTSSGGSGHQHGGASQQMERHRVGVVQVIEVRDDGRAIVKVIEGRVESDVTVERMN